MGEHTFDRDLTIDRDLMAEHNLMAEAVARTAGVDGQRLARLRVIARLDTTRAYAYDGFTSPTTFLVARCGLGVGEANREVFLARSLDHMPYATKLAQNDRLSVNQLEVLAHGRSRHPGAYDIDEPSLAEAITGLDLADTRRAVEYWAQAHDQPEDSEQDDEPSQVHLSKTWNQRGRLDGDLDPETYELMDAALETLIGELVNTTPKDELPSRPELRAQALAEILRRHLDSPDTPTDHGNRPHLSVIIDWETLSGARKGGLSEFTSGTIVAAETARRYACDTNVCRLLTGPNSEILDLGRTRRTVSPAQWKALRARDRHCQFPGCRRPWLWADAHHLIPWAQDGPTDLNNLILLCRHHHTLVHEGGWTLTGTVTNPIFRRPDGTTLPNGPP